MRHPAPANRLTMRQKIARELRIPARRALFGDAPLPTRPWEDVSRGRTTLAADLVLRGRDARLHAHRSAAELRAGLHQLADVIERELLRAA